MKITMYELLGLVKDGKAPKKIKYNDKIWDYDNRCQDYFYLNVNDDLFGRLFNDLPTNDFINDYVEIIEESKKIEKIDFGTLNTQEEKNKVMKDTINQLIDEINNLKEK